MPYIDIVMTSKSPTHKSLYINNRIYLQLLLNRIIIELYVTIN